MVTGSPTIGLAGIEPINQVTPFTYRDNATYLTILKSLADQFNLLVGQINDILDAAQENAAEAFAILVQQINAELADLQHQIDSIQTDGVSFDPTEGQLKKGTSTVISRTYDNVRVFAYFAKELDAKNWTAKQYDDMQNSARHFDLALAHPELHDAMVTP